MCRIMQNIERFRNIYICIKYIQNTVHNQNTVHKIINRWNFIVKSDANCGAPKNIKGIFI